jgi:hypothetical protein
LILAARGEQTLAMVPALAKLLDEGIQRGEGDLDVAAAVRAPGRERRKAASSLVA